MSTASKKEMSFSDDDLDMDPSPDWVISSSKLRLPRLPERFRFMLGTCMFWTACVFLAAGCKAFRSPSRGPAVEKSDEEVTKSKEARLYLSLLWAILVERLFLDARRLRGWTF